MPLGFRSPVLGPRSQRVWFLNTIQSIAGARPVASWLPSFTDSLTSIDPISGKLWTADAAMNGQITPRNKGYVRAFNGSTNFLTTPDTADTSFVEPTAMTLFVVANVTDTAAVREIITKWTATGSQREYAWFINGTDDTAQILLRDELNLVQDLVATNAAITQGSWATLCLTYSGVGGASAGNGVIIYQAAAVLANTPTNSASYSKMVNGTAGVMIGGINAGATNPFQGSIGFAALFASALSAAQVAGLNATSRQYFGF